MRILVSIALILAVQSGSLAPTTADPAKCKLCSAAVTECKVIWTDKDVKDLLEIGKTALCANVPIENCNGWISGKISQLDNTIANLTPRSVCGGVCSSRLEQAWTQDGIQCDFCKFVGEEVMTRLVNNATIDEACAVAEQACASIPIQLVSNECVALVKEYGHYYLDILAGTIDVASLCNKMGLCESDVLNMVEQSALFQTVYQGLQNDQGCNACLDGITIAKIIVNSAEFLDLVHMGVHDVCTVVQVTGCELIMKTVVDQAIKNFIPKVEPASFCKSSGACPDLIVAVIPVEDMSKDSSPGCQACTDGFDELKKIANDKDTNVIVEDLAPVICETISIPFCQRIIGGLITSQLTKIKTLDVAGTCRSLGACTSPSLEESTPAVEDQVCDECTLVAGFILDQLNEPAFQAQIEGMLDETCAFLPMSDCKEMMHGYMVEFQQLLSLYNGSSVCHYMGLCGFETLFGAVRELRNLQDDTLPCQFCQSYVANTFLPFLQQDELYTEAREAAKQLCQFCPDPNCEADAGKYIDIAEGVLRNITETDICQLMGLCWMSSSPAVYQPQGDSCSECKLIATEVLTLLQNGEIDALVEDAIGELCSVIPVDNCAKLLNGYFTDLLSLIKNLDADTLCSLVGLC